MHNNHLIKIIKTFSKKEMTRFWEFSRSPYFNKHSDVRGLIGYLNEQFPDFKERKLERHYLFKKLFENEPHNQQKLALVFTYSLRLVERFLEIEQFGTDRFSQNLALLKKLREKELYGYYDKKLSKSESYFSKDSGSIINETHSRFRLWQERNLYFNQLYKTVQNQELEEKQDYLDRFYFSEKLKDACELKFRSQILKTDVFYELPLLQNVLKKVESDEINYFTDDAIIVYFEIYKLLNTNNNDQYFEILKILKTRENNFPTAELQNIYNYLQNYCIRQINLGNSQFLKELFKIYQSQLEKGLLMVDKYLPEFHYKNIVTTGLRLNENDWVLSFIEEHKGLLKPSVVENAYSYNLASYYYNTNQLEKVLDLLIRVEYTDIRYNLGAKSLLLRTYFDLDEEEAFLSLTDAFRQFLKRNKILSEFQKEGYYNLIKFARKVFQIKSLIGFESKTKLRLDFQKLMTEIEHSKAIFNQSWLKGKVEELKENLNIV